MWALSLGLPSFFSVSGTCRGTCWTLAHCHPRPLPPARTHTHSLSHQLIAYKCMQMRQKDTKECPTGQGRKKRKEKERKPTYPSFRRTFYWNCVCRLSLLFLLLLFLLSILRLLRWLPLLPSLASKDVCIYCKWRKFSSFRLLLVLMGVFA